MNLVLLRFVLLIGFPAWINAAIGLVMLGATARWFWLRRRAQTWVATRAKILRCDLQTYSTRGGKRYRAAPTYEYVVQGRRYQGKRAFFGDRWWCGSQEEAEQEQRDSYAVGTWLTAYYDPRRPGQATLDRQRFTGLIWLLVFGLIFTSFGLTIGLAVTQGSLETCHLSATNLTPPPGSRPWCYQYLGLPQP